MAKASTFFRLDDYFEIVFLAFLSYIGEIQKIFFLFVISLFGTLELSFTLEMQISALNFYKTTVLNSAVYMHLWFNM